MGRSKIDQLMHAVSENDLRGVRDLLQGGIDPNVRTRRGYSPLHYAAMKNHAEIADILIEHGADLDAVDAHQEKTPLYYAAAYGSSDVARLLLEHGAAVDKATDGYTPLCIAAQNGDLPMIRLLAGRGANLNGAKESGSVAPLYNEAGAGSLSAVRLLLDLGADVNYGRGQAGGTALHNASAYGNIEVLQELIARGAEVNAHDAEGWPPISFARGNTAVIDLLTRYGAEPHAPYEDDFEEDRIQNGNRNDQ